MKKISALEIVELYILRAASAYDAATLEVLRRASLDSIHAMHAAGLLNATENEESLNRFVDACHQRYGELVGQCSSYLRNAAGGRGQ